MNLTFSQLMKDKLIRHYQAKSFSPAIFDRQHRLEFFCIHMKNVGQDNQCFLYWLNFRREKMRNIEREIFLFNLK